MSQGWDAGGGEMPAWGGAQDDPPRAPWDSLAPPGTEAAGDHGRPAWHYLLGGALLLAVVIGGGVAVQLFALLDGARSPEEAVQEVLDGLRDNNPLVIAAMITPSERRDLQDVVGRLIELAGELRAGEDIDDALTPITIDTSDITLEVDELGVDIAMVILGGELSVEVDPDDAPGGLEDFYEDLEEQLDVVGDIDLGDLGEHGARNVDEAFVIVVREGRGWYVSPSLTLAELIVQEQDLAEGDFGAYAEVDPEGGADSPVAAVEALADALDDLDVKDMLALLPPREAAVARVYQALFADGIDEIERSAADAEADIEVDDLDLIDLGDGRVRIANVQITAADRFSEATFALHGHCATFADEFTDGVEEVCLDDLDDDLDGRVHHREFLTGFGDGFEVVAVEEGGRWYLSPMATLSRAMVQALEGASAAALVADSAPWTAPAAGALQPGTGQEGDLGDSASYDVWDLPASEDDRIVATCVDDADLRLDAFTLDGAELDERHRGADGVLVAPLEDDRELRLVVTARSVGHADLYDMDSQLIDADEAFLPVEASGNRCDITAVRLSVEEGDTIELDGGDAITTFISPDEVASLVQPGFFTFDDDGEWTVVITGSDGGWDLTIDEAEFEVDEFGDLVLLDIVDVVETDGRAFTFTVPEAGRVTLTATPESSSLDPTIELRNADGGFIADDLGDGSMSELSERLDAGTYEARIVPYEGESSGEGRLVVVLQQ